MQQKMLSKYSPFLDCFRALQFCIRHGKPVYEIVNHASYSSLNEKDKQAINAMIKASAKV